MKDSWKWLILFSVVFMMVLILALPFFLRSSYGWMPMMGLRGYSTNNNINMIGGFTMIGMILIPLVLIGLTMLILIAFLVQRANRVSLQPQLQACTHCGKFIQADWKVCPYCGTKVK